MSILLCIGGGKAIALAAGLFTLSWTHSVEKVTWQESWATTQDGLVLKEARVKGSGAGMEPPEGAVLKDGWWTYRPALPPRPEIMLAASGATPSGWTLCTPGACYELGAVAGAAITLSVCEAGDTAAPSSGASQPR